MTLRTLDIHLIHFFKKVADPAARIAFFVIFFWFGILKVFDLSPASPLVEALFMNTMPIMPFDVFMVLFGFFECLIGILFLIPRLERVVLPLLLVHMVMTSMPLFVLPAITWSAAFVPTLEGQYIIKNLALIAAAMGIMAHLHPMHAYHFLKK
jgi:uncharacterized membrane protein YkgB